MDFDVEKGYVRSYMISFWLGSLWTLKSSLFSYLLFRLSNRWVDWGSPVNYVMFEEVLDFITLHGSTLADYREDGKKSVTKEEAWLKNQGYVISFKPDLR